MILVLPEEENCQMPELFCCAPLVTVSPPAVVDAKTNWPALLMDMLFTTCEAVMFRVAPAVPESESVCMPEEAKPVFGPVRNEAPVFGPVPAVESMYGAMTLLNSSLPLGEIETPAPRPGPLLEPLSTLPVGRPVMGTLVPPSRGELRAGPVTFEDVEPSRATMVIALLAQPLAALAQNRPRLLLWPVGPKLLVPPMTKTVLSVSGSVKVYCAAVPMK
jgi:hypothetical protein